MTLNLLVDDDQNFLDFMGFSGKSEKDRITVPLGNRGSSTGDMKQFFFCFQNVCTVICIQIVSLIIVIIWPRNAVTHVNNENVCSAVE